MEAEMKKVLIVDDSPIGQALEVIFTARYECEVLIAKDEDAVIDAMSDFQADAIVIGIPDSHPKKGKLAKFARVNAQPGQRVVQLGWEKTSPSDDPNYVRLPILGDDLIKKLFEASNPSGG
jgi:hypothetical protein